MSFGYFSQDGAQKRRGLFESRHSTDALDRAATASEVGASIELIQMQGRNPPMAAQTAALKASSSVASDDQYKSLDRFGSVDSSDTFLSCNTHPFPSQGSLAGLEELAAVGSMAANGSMPAVNIPSFNNSVYVNPFDPPNSRGKRSRGEHASRGGTTGAGGGVASSSKAGPDSSTTPNRTLTPSPQGSPRSPHSRRVRIGGRSVSSDVELADFESDVSAANRDAYHEDVRGPKHKRARVSQVRQPFFVL